MPRREKSDGIEGRERSVVLQLVFAARCRVRDFQVDFSAHDCAEHGGRPGLEQFVQKKLRPVSGVVDLPKRVSVGAIFFGDFFSQLAIALLSRTLRPLWKRRRAMRTKTRCIVTSLTIPERMHRPLKSTAERSRSCVRVT